jgi:hypothetical protein
MNTDEARRTEFVVFRVFNPVTLLAHIIDLYLPFDVHTSASTACFLRYHVWRYPGQEQGLVR